MHLNCKASLTGAPRCATIAAPQGDTASTYHHAQLQRKARNVI
jgi:hypothetical protein